MAVDRWLLHQVSQGLHPPTLRFYTWFPPAISVGRNQHHLPQGWHGLSWQGHPVEVVRRPTGGQAVLHQGELTYALVLRGLRGDGRGSSLSTPLRPVGEYRRQVYQQLCEFLIQGWQSLGIELRYGQGGRASSHQPNCFATATPADLVLANGTKLIGSAQAWRGDVVLQHGSIQLQPEPQLWAQVFGVESNQSLGLLPAQVPRMSTLIERLTQAAQRCFQTEFTVQPLSEQEWEDIKRFVDMPIGRSPIP